MTRDTLIGQEPKSDTIAPASDLPRLPPVVPARQARRRRRLRRAMIRLALLAASLFVSLLMCEFAVRIFSPQVLFPRYVTDGGFGVRVNVPNARYWHTSPEVHVQFRINSMGIRSDREYSFRKPPGTIRIVGLGDSFTQGYEVDLADTYLYRLEEILAARGLPVEVINLGVSGYGNAEELLMLEELGLRFDPDVVVVAFFQNDLHDNVRSGLFRLDAHDQLVRDAQEYLPAIGIRDRLYSFWAYRWAAEHSHLLSLCRERLARVVKRRRVQKNVDQLAPGGADDYPARLAGRLLEEIKHRCDQRDVAFLLMDIPGATLESNLPIGALQEISAEQLVRPAKRLRAEGSDAYLYRRCGHSHWTPRAHEIAAEMLAGALVPVLEQRSAGPPTSRFEP